MIDDLGIDLDTLKVTICSILVYVNIRTVSALLSQVHDFIFSEDVHLQSNTMIIICEAENPKNKVVLTDVFSLEEILKEANEI